MITYAITNLPFTYLMVLFLLMFSCTQSPPSPVNDDISDPQSFNHSPPPIGYATPEYCGSCHEEHYQTWRGSMHAYATVDPVFQAMNAKGIAETEGRLDQFCVQCHAPSASLRDILPVEETTEGFVQPLDMDNPLVHHGVQCVSCHNIESVQATQNAKVTLSDTTYFGPTGSEAANMAHPMEASPLFSSPTQESILCGSCHDVLNPNGARLEATFSEWYASSYNAPLSPMEHRTCQDCHMPSYRGKIIKDGEEKDIHSHAFIGVDLAMIESFPNREIQRSLVEELLRNSSLLELRDNGINEDGDAVIVASVTNINNGHNLPSGSTADRQVWVHLQVKDEQGRMVYESGMKDSNGDLMDGVQGHSLTPDGDPELLLYGQLIFGEDGEHVTFPWQAHSYADHLLAPGQKGWRDYVIPIEGVQGNTLECTATLRYRTFPPFLIRTLIQEGRLDPERLLPIPEFEVHRETIQVRIR